MHPFSGVRVSYRDYLLRVGKGAGEVEEEEGVGVRGAGDCKAVSAGQCQVMPTVTAALASRGERGGGLELHCTAS